jgi:hypothetical protein
MAEFLKWAMTEITGAELQRACRSRLSLATRHRGAASATARSPLGFVCLRFGHPTLTDAFAALTLGRGCGGAGQWRGCDGLLGFEVLERLLNA